MAEYGEEGKDRAMKERRRLTSLGSQDAGVVWSITGLRYGWEWSEGGEEDGVVASSGHAKSLTFPTSPEWRISNSSLYAHIIAVRKTGGDDNNINNNVNDNGVANVGEDGIGGDDNVVHVVHPVVVFKPKPKEDTRVSLLGFGGGDDVVDDVVEEVVEKVVEKVESGEETGEEELVAYWVPQMDVKMVMDQTGYPSIESVQEPIRSMYTFSEEKDRYEPPLYVNAFWVLESSYVVVNETVEEVELAMSFGPQSLLWWIMGQQMQTSMETQSTLSGAGQLDEFRRILLETNPWLLALTATVSLLHMVFDMLAFKNDVQHWRQKKSMQGMSVKTLFVNLIFQVIILLYLLENETSWMILFSMGAGILIEAWKIQKAVIVGWDPKYRWYFPVTFTDRATYVSETKKYDDLAFGYLAYIVYPAIAGFALYSLLYRTHKSWYSFVLGTAVSFVYAFGFAMMWPVVFINYRLKTVAHLPFRMFMYKALSTTIDDVFAFVISMPLAHRIACFRDDIVFAVILYQRWIYPTDPNRRYDEDLGDAPDKVKDE